jgi:hypothetical protein
MKLRLLQQSFLIGFVALAQEPAQELPELSPSERQFQESMNDVALDGFSLVDDSKDLHEDHYVIERITKVGEDTWKFQAKVRVNDRDVKVTIPVPVKFAGDTPVISLTNFVVPGFGKFSARIVFWNGGYAGTWTSGKTRGKLFGKVNRDSTSPTPF